jgi:hypothetical protein
VAVQGNGSCQPAGIVDAPEVRTVQSIRVFQAPTEGLRKKIYHKVTENTERKTKKN